MQYKQKKRHIVDILFVIALFGAFTLCTLILVVLGSNVYKNTISSMSQNFESRTTCSYITEKLRQNDLYDSIYIDTLENVPALVLTQEISDSVYGTYIYYHDGELKELFMKLNSNIGSNPLDAGITIMELRDFHVKHINEKLLEITLVMSDSETKTIYISLHSTQQEVNQ